MLSVKEAAGPKSPSAVRSARLFFLEVSGGHIRLVNPDGSDRTTIVSDARIPCGIAVDPEAGHVYWTNMGSIGVDDGSIERVDLDGGNRTVIVPPGVTHTPKQIHAQGNLTGIAYVEV